MRIINNKCSNCGHDGINGWLMSIPVQCPECRESDEFDEDQSKKDFEGHVRVVQLGDIVPFDGMLFVSMVDIEKKIDEIEDVILDKILNLKTSFWGDEDHSVGGYISKKDIKELLLSLKTKSKK